MHINIDEYREKSTVVVSGKEYEIDHIGVGEFIDQTLVAAMSGNSIDNMDAMVTFVKENSNIPLNILKKQQVKQISALVSVVQGITPEELEKKMNPAPEAEESTGKK